MRENWKCSELFPGKKPRFFNREMTRNDAKEDRRSLGCWRGCLDSVGPNKRNDRLEALSQITGAACRMLEQKQNREGNPEYSHGAAADLLTAGIVVPRSKPAAGIEPASRLASGQNLWRRHPLLFMRELLGSAEQNGFLRHKTETQFEEEKIGKDNLLSLEHLP